MPRVCAGTLFSANTVILSTIHQPSSAVYFSFDTTVLLSETLTPSECVAHCQAHGAYGANRFGVPDEKVQAIWSFETSDLFDDRERAALRFGFAAGCVPSAVTAEHHAGLREHFTDEEARALIAVVALGGFMNRYNDALATVQVCFTTEPNA